MTKPHIQPDPVDPLLTTRKAALLLCVTPQSVRNYVKRGDLRAITTPGGHGRIRTSGVHALAAKMGIKTAGPAANPPQTQLDDAHQQIADQVAEIKQLRAEVERLQAPRVPLTDEQAERLIDESDGRWVDSEYRIDGAGLMKLLREAANQEGGAA